MRFWDLHPNLQIRIGVSFVQRFLQVMVMPLMTIFLAAEYGAAVAGILMLAVVSAEVVGTLLGGYLADIHGRRHMLLVGELGVAGAFAVMACASAGRWDSALAIYLSFVATSLAASLALPSNDAMIVDLTTPTTRKFVYTVNYWTINLALACGALIGGFLYDDYFPEMLIGAAVLSAGVFVVTLLRITETSPRAVECPGPTPTSYVRGFLLGYRRVLLDQIFLVLLFAATLRMALEVQINYYIAIRISKTFTPQDLFSFGGWSPHITGVELLGILRAENTLLVTLLAFMVYATLKKVADGIRLYAGVVIFTAGCIPLAVSNAVWLLATAVAVLTIGELISVPVQQALIAELVPEDARTKYMAIYNLNIRLGMLLASLCVTVGSLSTPWAMAGLYGAFGLAILIAFRWTLSTAVGDRDLVIGG